jgi:zinc transport system ATP-binding protein
MTSVREGPACSGLCCTKINQFGVTYGRHTILHDVNLHIHCGELTALIGPNGAGKSTLLKAILGEVKHTGELSFLDEKNLRTTPVMGYVPQQMQVDTGAPASVLDLFAACGRFPSWLKVTRSVRAEAERSLQRVNAEHLMERRLGALSGGELQRVLLALALSPVPDLLLLDEPATGIDQLGLEMFYKTVAELRQKYDLSILLVSHDLDMVARHADRVILLNGTVVRSGTPQEVFGDPRTMELFGMTWFQRHRSGNGGSDA